MSKKKEDKIAIVIDGMDICRIIPFKPDQGKYEIKMEFLGNEFETSCYRLFSRRPIRWEIPNSDKVEVTYHKGENAKPLTIHLKQKEKIKGQPIYKNLPLKRILAPNVNQVFPMPILKLEIPDTASVRKYKRKSYHKVLAPNDCNVIELYLINSNFDIEEFFGKYSAMELAFMMLSFEVFATNTVATDYQKFENIIPSDKSRQLMTSFPIFNDMRIIAVHYKDPELNKRLSKIKATFIENELAESILTMMQIRYPQSRDGEFDEIYLGAATLKEVNDLVVPLARPSIDSNNLISDAFKRNSLTQEEKESLYQHSLKLRIQLKTAMIEHQKKNEEIKSTLTDDIVTFLNAIKKIKSNLDEQQLEADEYRWFSSYPQDPNVELLLMVAKYLGRQSCVLYAQRIGKPNSNYSKFHAWLQYDDMFDVDVSYSTLSEFTKMNMDEIKIFPAEEHPLQTNFDELFQAIRNNGFERDSLIIVDYSVENFGQYFMGKDNLLERIYLRILTVIKENPCG